MSAGAAWSECGSESAGTASGNGIAGELRRNARGDALAATFGIVGLGVSGFRTPFNPFDAAAAAGGCLVFLGFGCAACPSAAASVGGGGGFDGFVLAAVGLPIDLARALACFGMYKILFLRVTRVANETLTGVGLGGSGSVAAGSSAGCAGASSTTVGGISTTVAPTTSAGRLATATRSAERGYVRLSLAN